MVYLDSCIAIYLVEEHPSHGPAIEAALVADETYCISPLVEMECMILPIRLRRDDLVAKFQRFFSIQRQLELPNVVFHAAAELRARHGLKTPDALHLATARHHQCTAFWTNDDRLKVVAGALAVNVLSARI